MRLSRRILVWLIVTCTLAAALPAAAGEPRFRRGIGVSHLFGWAEVGGIRKDTIVFPPFAGPDRIMPVAEMRALREAGFDFVRLAVDPAPFLAFDRDRKRAVRVMVLEQVKTFLAVGLGVIVDLHPSAGEGPFNDRALVAGPQDPAFRAYLAALGEIAGDLAPLARERVALEVMNEPVIPTRAWQPMLEAAYRAARARAPDLLLVLGGGSYNAAPELVALDATPFRGDPALLFTFHSYEPGPFTHQGAPWADTRYFADVPYPARARPLTEMLDASRAAIAASSLSPVERARALGAMAATLTNYARSDFGRDDLARLFGTVAAWARRNGIPPGRILLGEFGARRGEGTLEAERARYFRDVRQLAEAQGFAWAVWVYRGWGGFALAGERGGPAIEPLVRDALLPRGE
ncbi:glycoside hydrolase family 5 protein [Methylobacterium sp. JK268]